MRDFHNEESIEIRCMLLQAPCGLRTSQYYVYIPKLYYRFSCALNFSVNKIFGHQIINTLISIKRKKVQEDS